MTPETRTRLVRLLGMLGSAHDGERANAAALADRLVRNAGLVWDQVVAPVGSAGERARGEEPTNLSFGEQDFEDLLRCQMTLTIFTEKQRALIAGFIDYLEHHPHLTGRQRAVLDDLVARIQRRGRAA